MIIITKQREMIMSHQGENNNGIQKGDNLDVSTNLIMITNQTKYHY